MDTSRLLEVLADVQTELTGMFQEKLTELINQYTIAKDSSVDNTPAITNALSILTTHVNNSIFKEYPPSKLAILKAIKGNAHLGPEFLDELDRILLIRGQTISGIVAKLEELQKRMAAFTKATNTAVAGLQSIGIKRHTLKSEQFEGGILIPENLVDKHLGTLAKELESWNRIVRGFQEIAGEQEREVTVSSIASGSYEIYIALGFTVALIITKIIERILEWFERITAIRKHRIELQNLEVPADETEKYKNYEKDIIEKNISDLAKEIVNEANPNVDEARKNELVVQAEFSIRQIASFIDKGGILEVSAPPPEIIPEPNISPETEQETDEQKRDRINQLERYEKLKLTADNIARIRNAGSKLQLLPEHRVPILQLSDESVSNQGLPQKEEVIKKKAK